ncbi:MAG: nucleoside hydrolase, partial [Thermocrispum sp.]
HPHRARYAHGSDGLSGRSAALPASSAQLAGVGAVELMASLLRSSAEPVTLAPIGPLTNVALLLAAYPELTARIDRIVIMGGALGGGNVTARAEFNVWSDPEAARRVLTEPGVRCVLVPMDLTYRCALDLPWLDRLAAAGPVGATLRALTTDYLEHYTKALGRPAVVIHDAVAVAEAIRPGTLRTARYPLDVECAFGPSRGALITDQRRRELIAETEPTDTDPVEVAVDADLDGLRASLLGGLSRVR